MSWCNCCPPTPTIVVIIATQYVQYIIFPGFIFLVSKRTTSEGTFASLVILIWQRLLTCSRAFSISMKNWVCWNPYFVSWSTNNNTKHYEEVVFILCLYVYIILWTFLSSDDVHKTIETLIRFSNPRSAWFDGWSWISRAHYWECLNCCWNHFCIVFYISLFWSCKL